MSIGEMKEPLTLQQEALTPDGGGGFARAWEDVAAVFGRIEETGGGESLQNRKVEAGNACRITLHYRNDVTAGMRLAGEAGIFDIFAVRDPDGRRATLEITGYRRT